MKDDKSKIDSMLAAIESGSVVYISTHTRSTRIDKAALNRWTKAGLELLKSSGGSMYMATGRKFVCIDYCKITISNKG